MHAPHHIQAHLRTRTHTHRESHAHTYTYELTYEKTSTYINKSVNLNMHAHGLTCTHIYVKIKNTQYLICYYIFITCSQLYAYNKTLTITLTLAFEHTCIKQTPNLNLTPTLTKHAQNPREFKIPISDSGFHYNIFSDKTHNHTPFKNPINIPDYLLHITSYLNQTVQHVNP